MKLSYEFLCVRLETIEATEEDPDFFDRFISVQSEISKIDEVRMLGAHFLSLQRKTLHRRNTKEERVIYLGEIYDYYQKN